MNEFSFYWIWPFFCWFWLRLVKNANPNRNDRFLTGWNVTVGKRSHAIADAPFLFPRHTSSLNKHHLWNKILQHAVAAPGIVAQESTVGCGIQNYGRYGSFTFMPSGCSQRHLDGLLFTQRMQYAQNKSHANRLSKQSYMHRTAERRELLVCGKNQGEATCKSVIFLMTTRYRGEKL